MPDRVTEENGRLGLGTFAGVFTPSILTILGVIMYLRLGWVVGSVGLPATLLIVTLSSMITFLTALSISSIATDQRVKTGGAYYMISHSMGIETGGAVGVPLFLAQALSVALYTAGFAESFVRIVPIFDARLVAIATTIGVALVALLSARAAIRVQYVTMAVIAASLLSIIFGSRLGVPDPELLRITPRPDFWPVFAVFFPAVTGIMAGVNLSGDLKDPARSLPRGTFAAVGTGYLIYMILPVLLVLRASAPELIDDPLIMRRIAVWGDVILLGVWAATLSSAVGSILGAPRVLQALVRDKIFPGWLRWLGKGSGVNDEPRIGTAFTLVIAIAAVWFGSLNVIAPILTMFFLTTYGVLNLAAGLERIIGNPSFRPTFRIHWAWSFLGAIACGAVMFLINPLAAIVAVVAVFLIFLWLERREMKTTWGSVRGGLWMALARAALLRLSRESDPKNWRPHLLVLSGAPTKRWHLIDLASSFAHNKALMTVATVLPEDTADAARQSSMELVITEYLARQGVQGLAHVSTGPDYYRGAVRLIESYGLGRMVPNTILMGASDTEEHQAEYCEMIAGFYKARRNIAIVHHNPQRGYGRRRHVDVWWGGLKQNGSLMMILAYLLKTSAGWRDAEVCVKMIVSGEEVVPGVREKLSSLVEDLRTGATNEVIVAGGRSFDEILHANSKDADVIFLGMAEPGEDFRQYYQTLQNRIIGLPTTVSVLAAEQLAFREILIQT
ncbi:Na-K-Cl cotransporter [Gemmatimonadota bacterium]